MHGRTSILLLAGTLLFCNPATASNARRIDLVEFGRVVDLPDAPRRVTTEADELARGVEGWQAVRGENGLYTIGVEWDEPRDIAEVNIEFRHAIANREQIKVQYWLADEAQGAVDDRDRPEPGRWMTPRTEWWAGDRDVSFSFLPEDAETADRGRPGGLTRRTVRLRFVCGRDDLPPVRYLRAYGPEAAATDTFDLRLDERLAPAPPVAVTTVNAFVIAGDGRTKMTSAVLRDRSASLQLRYGRTTPDSPNRSRVVLSGVEAPKKQIVFDPAEVARLGQVRLAEQGLTIERRGGRISEPAGTSGTRPAMPGGRR